MRTIESISVALAKDLGADKANENSRRTDVSKTSDLNMRTETKHPRRISHRSGCIHIVEVSKTSKRNQTRRETPRKVNETINPEISKWERKS